MKKDNQKDLKKLLIEMGYKHGIHEVFVDFLELSALAIANKFDLTQFDAREKQYLALAKRYTSADLCKFAEMLSLLTLSLLDEAACGKLRDVLGMIYHGLDLHNKWKGQFFTPQNVCDMMGSILLGSTPPNDKLSILEPCVGSGAMVLGFVNAMIDMRLRYTRDLTVSAIDTDLKCVHMAFLQFSLYGIPATVIHGNSLTNEQWSVWRTPMLYIRL